MTPLTMTTTDSTETTNYCVNIYSLGIMCYNFSQGTSMTVQQNLKELERLSALLSKYKHRWNSGDCSDRLRNWMDKYNDIKEQDTEAWSAFCDKCGFSKDHEAFDCLC